MNLRNHRRGVAARGLMLGLLGLAGCGGRADLTLLLAPASLECTLDTEPRVTVEVVNQGSREARATTTGLQFPSFEVRLPTRPLAPGASHRVSSALPKQCVTEGCRFTAVVDRKGEVKESREDNNRAEGVCRGRSATVPPSRRR